MGGHLREKHHQEEESMAKYMAYVGSYSYTGKSKGITVYDVDVEKGKFIKRCEVEVDNSSYVIASMITKLCIRLLMRALWPSVFLKTEVCPG